MDTQTNPLLQLEPQKQQQLVDLVENGDIETVADATGMSRRQVLMAAAALGVGALGGGMTAREFIQQAEAAASTSDSDGNVGLPGDRVDVFADGVDSTSVNTDTAKTTNQTYAILTRGSNSNSTSSGTFINPYTGDSKDRRNEVSSGQLNPDQSGEYTIIASIKIDGNTQSGDLLRAQVYDVTNNTALGPEDQRSVSTAAPDMQFFFGATLTAGTTYEIQVTNQNSSFVVKSANAEGRIYKTVTQ